MPNWCFTTYKIVGDKEQLAKINDMLNELNGMKEPRVKNGFGKLWLGCIVDYLGEDWNKVSCRGDVVDYRLDDNELTMYIEIAWAESPEFRHLLEKYYNVGVYHISEEPGCAGYWTNDIDGSVFHTKYFLDTSDVDAEPDYFETIEDVARYINDNDVLGVNVESNYKSIVDAIDKWEEDEIHEDQYISLREFEYVDD